MTAHAALRPLLESGGYTSGQDSDERDYDENSDACSMFSGATLDGIDDQGLDSEDESFSASVVAESRSELEEMLARNQTYQALVQNILVDLNAALERNRKMQRELPQRLIERSSQLDKRSLCKDWHQSLVFTFPYFRDVNGMRAPMNEDERTKRASKEMDPYIVPAAVWTTEENRMLVKAVHNSLLKENARALMNRKESLQERLDQEVEDDPKIVQKIQELDAQLEEMQRLDLPELLERSVRPVDWLHVAAVNMGAHRDAFACEMHWRHLLDVRLNRAQWTPEEDERLRNLAQAHSEFNWDKVAQELKTNRSMFQCAQRYASMLMPRLNTGAFSAEEDLRLLQLVTICKEGADISWPQVSHFMGCRSKNQVVSRYKRSLHPELQHGRWTAEEDIMLLVAINLYGSQGWHKVATLLPGRSGHQCREHYKDHYAQKIVSGSYTADEDVVLLQLVEKHGAGHWSKVAKEMPWRTPNSVLLRYKQLRKVLSVEEPRVADLQNPDAVGLATQSSRPGPGHPPRQSAMERRSDLYRRICRLIPTPRQRHAALMLCKGQGDAVTREACLSLYQRMLKQHQGSLRPQPTVQNRNLNKAIAQFAQPLHRPFPPSLAAYEHQEWQGILNVLHDLHGLERPPVDPRAAGAASVPVFEDFFRQEVLGVPEKFQPGDLVLPLLPPNETNVATFGRMVDRFANGRLTECLSVLDDYASYPELAAAFDADTVEEVRCSGCASRLQLEEKLAGGALGPAAEEEPCRRCAELREARRNYYTLRARFISYFFWPAVMDSQKVPETVELHPDPSKRKPKSHYRRKKQRKPWVKKKWEERKRVQAMALAASFAGVPPKDDAGTSCCESTGDVAGTSGTQRPPRDPEEGDSSSE